MIRGILGPFVNPFTADNRYSLLNRSNLLHHFKMHLSRKRKIFSIFYLFIIFFFFLHFLILDSILNIFKKKMTLIADVILNWRKLNWNTWLDKCLKSPLSEDLLTSNMVNEPKHCSKLDESTITSFIAPCNGNSGWKSLSAWYAKS